MAQGTAKSRKIWILCSSLDRGGSERQLTQLAAFLAERGHEVTVVSLVKPRTQHQFPLDPKAKLRQLDSNGPADLLRALAPLAKEAKAEGVQDLISFTLPANVLGRFLRLRLGNVRLITSVRTSQIAGPYAPLMKFTRGADAAAVFNAPDVAENLSKAGFVVPDRVRVIRNAISVQGSTEEKRAQLRQAHGVGAQEFSWVMVGRLVPLKNHAEVLKALARPELSAHRLLVVGDGEAAGELKALAESLGIASRIVWAGHQSNVGEWLHAADAAVLASQWEGSPNALLEAMFAGLPAVATQVGGVRDVIDEGKSGFLAATKDAQGLGDAMAKLAALTPPARAALAEAGAKKVREGYGSDAVWTAWRDLIEV